MIEAGKLNCRLTISQGQTTRSPTGSETTVWTPVAQVWAERRELSLRQTTRAAGSQQSAEAKFRIRYRIGLKPGMEVEAGGERYAVVAIEILPDRDGLELLVKAV